jgi:hypothetical protein
MHAASSLRPRGIHPIGHELLLALWLATVGNLALWRAVYLTPDVQQPGGLLVMAALAVMVTTALVAALGAVMWGPWRRGLGVLLLLLSSVAGYFMFTYGIVVDPGMVANVFHTDRLETQGLLSGQLAVALLVGAALPSLLWWRAPVRPVARRRQWWQRSATVLGALAVFAIALLVGFQGISSLMRNHNSTRCMAWWCRAWARPPWPPSPCAAWVWTPACAPTSPAAIARRWWCWWWARRCAQRTSAWVATPGQPRHACKPCALKATWCISPTSSPAVPARRCRCPACSRAWAVPA